MRKENINDSIQMNEIRILKSNTTGLEQHAIPLNIKC